MYILTIEHVHGHRGRVSIVGHTGVVAGVCQRGLRDQQLAGGATFSLLRLQADPPARGVEIHHGVTVVPIGRYVVRYVVFVK